MSKSPQSAVADPYQEWISSHVFQRNDGADFEARIAAWPRTPRFHLAVAHDSASVEALSLTLQSLAGQYYPHVFVTVASPLAPPQGLPADRLAWHQTSAIWQVANQALLASPADNWVGLIRAGDAIAPHAFLALAEHIVSHPELAAIYTDEDVQEVDGRRHSPKFKPDFDLELLRSTAYIGGLLLSQQETWAAAGGWQHKSPVSDEFDVALRLCECRQAAAIGHLADLLYHRHAEHPALATAPSCDPERLARLNEHLQRAAPDTKAIAGQAAGTARVLYPLSRTPRVSIIIPTRDQFDLLERCVSSIFSQTDYPDYEVLIVDNGSCDPTACTYLDGIRQMGDKRLQVLSYDQPFNFSAMNNLAAGEATGELLLLLNNDTAALHQDWLTEMVSLALQPEVGMVGARLLYPDGTIQHAGVIVGLCGPAEHPFIGWPSDKPAPLLRSHAIQRYSAVTAACALLPRDLYLSVGGMDEEDFKVSYNDIDLCLKIGQRGLRILWTPYATLLHEGSASQRKDDTADSPNPEKLARFTREQEAMYQHWMPSLVRDHAYNPNLSLISRNMEPEQEAVLSWNPTPWQPRPRLLVHPIDLSGCGEYRILAPSRALHDARICRGYASQRFFSPVEIAKADLRTVVIQHPTTSRHLKAMETYRRHANARCIIEIDDLITRIPRTSPHYQTIGKEAVAYFHRSLALADRLVVSTQPLAEAFGPWANEVVVQANLLEDKRWNNLQRPNENRKPRKKPRVGWAGSSSHVGDLQLLLPVIKKLAGEVDWIFLGLSLPEMRRYATEIHPAVPMADYPRKLAELDLDIALAPLEINAFNEAKSPLKVLEYGILGYPVICTDITPYQGDFPVTKVKNSEAAWVAAIRALAHDRERQIAEGNALHAYVECRYMLGQHLDAWRNTWLL